MKIRFISKDIDKEKIINEIRNDLIGKGITANFEYKTPSTVMARYIRIDPEIKGYNISPHSGRRGRVLGWKDWAEFNNTINNILDKYNASANVSSLGGKFIVREGTKRFTEEDWEHLKYENIGSRMQPVTRGEAWASEGKGWKLESARHSLARKGIKTGRKKR